VPYVSTGDFLPVLAHEIQKMTRFWRLEAEVLVEDPSSNLTFRSNALSDVHLVPKRNNL